MFNLNAMASAAHTVLVKKSHTDPLEMPASGAKWNTKAFEDYLTHGDDPRLPAVARKAIMQDHIEKTIAAVLHTPEEALSEAKSHGRWGGGTLGVLGGGLAGGVLGALMKHPGTGAAAGAVGGGVLGAALGAHHWGTPEAATKNVEKAKKFQAAMSALNADEPGKERMLSEALARRYESMTGFDDDDWDSKRADLSALVPGAKTTAAELGQALRLRTAQRGAQQLASTLGHVPTGKNPFQVARAVTPPPASIMGAAPALKFGGTGHEYSAGASPKPKKMKSRRAEPQLSGSFATLIERLGAGAA